jgi:hypothetical protein
MPEAMPVLEVVYAGAAESGSALLVVLFLVVLFWIDEFSASIIAAQRPQLSVMKS